MPVQPNISVVIPVWNRSHEILRAVASVIGQSRHDFELIIVDDGSTDGTQAVLSEFRDERIRIVTTARMGAGGARNVGANCAAGEWLAFLDSDDEVLPEWLEHLRSSVEGTAADLAICGVQFEQPDGSSTSYTPDPSHLGPDDVVPFFWAGSWMVRRELFEDVGGYDPGIAFGENSEFALRLFLRRRPLHIVPVAESLVRVRRRPGPVEHDARVRGAIAVIERYEEARSMIPATLASYHTLVGVDLARKGDPFAAYRHFFSAWRLQPSRPDRLLRLVGVLVPRVRRMLWGRQLDNPAVLFVVLAPGVGGSVRSLATELAHLSSVHRVVARPPACSTSEMIRSRMLAETTLDLPSGGRSRLVTRVRGTILVAQAAWRMRGHLAAIHANGLAELNLAVLPALLVGCRLVVWVHEWEVSRWTRRLAPVLRLLTAASQFAVVSEQSRKMLLDAGIARPGQMSLVPNPIDPRDVRSGKRVRSGGNGRLRVAYLGTPAEYKGFGLLPRLVGASDPEKVDWLIYAGPETLMTSTFLELRRLGASIRGKISDVREAYRDCDVVVVPSFRESFGRVAAEAMANAIPVVASDLPTLRAILGDGDAGLLAPAGDVGSFVEAIHRLVEDPGLREKLGRAGRCRSERFDPEPIVRRLAALYGVTLPNPPAQCRHATSAVYSGDEGPDTGRDNPGDIDER